MFKDWADKFWNPLRRLSSFLYKWVKPKNTLFHLPGTLLLLSRSSPAGPGPLREPLQWAIYGLDRNKVPPLRRLFHTPCPTPLLLSPLSSSLVHLWRMLSALEGPPLPALSLAPGEPLPRWRQAPPPLQRWMDRAACLIHSKTARHGTARTSSPGIET